MPLSRESPVVKPLTTAYSPSTHSSGESNNETVVLSPDSPGEESKEENEKFVYLRTPSGIRFDVPFAQARTFVGMTSFIGDAFSPLDDLFPAVSSGQYDLLHAGRRLNSVFWNDVIKPGWEITMAMWETKHSYSDESLDAGVRLYSRRRSRSPWYSQGRPLSPLRPTPPPRIQVSPKRRSYSYSSMPSRATYSVSRRSKRSRSPPPPLRASPYTGPSGEHTTWPRSRARAIKNGLVEVPQPAAQKRKMFRHLTFPLGGDNSPPPAVKRSIASVYAFGSEMKDRVTLEVTELVASNLVLKESAPAGEKDGFRWVHASRDYMDLEEFEHIALDPQNLQVDLNETHAIEGVLKTVRDNKTLKMGGSHYVIPGTVTRCDVTSGDKVFASAIFMSVPYLEAAPFSRSFRHMQRKGAQAPQRLHESSNPYDSSLEQDKRQVFLQYHGSKAGEVLWVREAWILVAGTRIITYGGQPPEAYLGKNIEIRARQPVWGEKDWGVRVKYKEKWFRLPLSQCETYFDLQFSIRAQVAILDNTKEEYLPDLILQFITGELITAGDWSRSMEAMQEKVIQVFPNRRRDYFEDSFPLSRRAAPYRLARDDRQSLLPVPQYDPASHALKQVGFPIDRRPSDGSALVRRADFFSYEDPGEPSTTPLLEAPQSESLIPGPPEIFRLPDLDPNVPPFLAWSIGRDEMSTGTAARATRTEQDMDASVAACLESVETALDQKDNKYVARLRDAFSNWDGHVAGVGVSTAQVHKKLSELRLEAKQGKDEGTQEYLTLYEDFVNASVRTLEAFAPERSGSRVLANCYRALYEGLEMRNKRKPPENSASRWVICAESLPDYLLEAGPKPYCITCVGEKIYDSQEQAILHLYNAHSMGETPESELVMEHVISLSAAATSKLNRDLCDALLEFRAILSTVIEHVVEIQSGTVSGGGRFQNPPYGVPSAMLEAMQILVTFVCSVPLFLGELDAFYKQSVYDESVSNLKLERDACMQRSRIEEAGHSLRAPMRKAERALISSLTSTKRDDAIKFFQPVGPHCLAVQMVDNLVRSSICDGKVISELYTEYVHDFGVQAKYRPSKRLLPKFGYLTEDLSRVQTLTAKQGQLVDLLDTFLFPTSYRDRIAAEVRDRTFPTEDYLILDTKAWLKAQEGQIKSTLDRCSDLVGEMRNTLEVLQDDNSRVLFVFTAVTVVFLPLSFVATYMSMNGGPSQEGWGSTQKVFWEVSAPLAVGVVIFCLVVARGYGSEEAGALGDWLQGLFGGRNGKKRARGAILERWRTGEPTDSGEEGASKIE